ncbi:MAG: flavodoxin family protein [Chitinophagales bacterium]
MPKVVIFNGSPRKNGYTSKLLKEVKKGAEANGAETITFDLNNSRIKGCQGCYYCRENDGCAIQDYLQPMYKEIAQADAVVFGSPIYCYQISGQSKIWLDRTFPMISGTTSADFSPRHPGKKLLTVYSQGSADEDKFIGNISQVNGILTAYGWDLLDSIICSGTTNPDFELSQELLELAFQNGQNLINS